MTYIPQVPLGQAVSASSIPQVIASDQTPIPVGNKVAKYYLTPAVQVAAYSLGYVIGGKITLTNAARVSGGSGLIQSVHVICKAALVGQYDVVFFDTDPTNGTYTDRTAYNLHPSDMPYLIGRVSCSDNTDHGTPKSAQSIGISMPFVANATSIYALIIARLPITYLSTSDIGLKAHILQD